MAAKESTKLVLAFRSGGICAFPNCGKALTYEASKGEDAHIGEAAHIRGEKPGAARYDATMSDAERNSVHNLIYLCTDHHTIIDKVPEDWQTQDLIDLKRSHEAMVREVVEQGFANVAFPELERAIEWVATQPPSSTGTFDIVSPEEKIQKNHLSNGSRHVVLAGLMSRATVALFVTTTAQLDPKFPDKLKAGYLAKYFEYRQAGIDGDDRFDLMCAFSQRGLKSQADRTAGLAVLIYLFEICDVFEK